MVTWHFEKKSIQTDPTSQIYITLINIVELYIDTSMLMEGNIIITLWKNFCE
jgi:hypothetical protein